MKLNEMIINIMREIRRTFEVSAESSEYIIENGTINLKEHYLVGEWILVQGSRLNNGIYRIGAVNGTILPLYTLSNGSDDENPTCADESFQGCVWRLNLPRDFIEMAEEITAWSNKSDNVPSDVVSHSVVGLYSETRATGHDGLPLGWKQVFGKRLGAFRRMFSTINLNGGGA